LTHRLSGLKPPIPFARFTTMAYPLPSNVLKEFDDIHKIPTSLPNGWSVNMA